MAPSFSKNAILVGKVDHLCLVCEAHLKSEEDILSHIDKPVHRKSFDTTNYVDSLERDHIRKIKMKYFCELCNVLMNTLAKVRIHITETKHVQNVHKPMFVRKRNAVIAFDNVVITEQAWNGLKGSACAICNIEYEDQNIHKTQTTHILNLVQWKVEINEEKNIYRKIDLSTFQCLTCNTVLALDSIDLHWKSPEHKNLYETSYAPKSKQLDEEIQSSEGSEYSGLNKEVISGKDITEFKDKTKISHSLQWLQKNGIQVNFELDQAVCEKCSTCLKLDLQYLKEHVKYHNDTKCQNNINLESTQNILLESKVKETSPSIKSEKRDIEDFAESYSKEAKDCKDSESDNSPVLSPADIEKDNNDKLKTSKIEKEIEDIARSNNMVLCHSDKSIHCNSCETNISYNLKSINNHIKTWIHKKKSHKQSKTVPMIDLKTKSINEFKGS